MKRGMSWFSSGLLRSPVSGLGWLAGRQLGGSAWHGLTGRWVFVWAGFALGMLGVSCVHPPTLGALGAQDDPVPSMQGKLATLQAQLRKAQTPSDAPQSPPALLAQLPTRDRQAVIWLQFSQLLAQHAVQLQSLRPMPDGAAAPLSSQAVAVRLHAQFDDWTAVWSALNAHGPVWSIDRLRIAPQAQGVDIEAVLRVWFGDGLGIDLGRPAPYQPRSELPQESPIKRVRTAVFWQVPDGAASAPLTESLSARGSDLQGKLEANDESFRSALTGPEGALAGAGHGSADPAQWPLAQIRLLGVWQHAQDAHALFAAGPHWAPARVGQRIGAEGHQVETIYPHEVHLRTNQGGLKVLGVGEASP